MRPDRREMPRRRSHLRRQPAARPPDRQRDLGKTVNAETAKHAKPTFAALARLAFQRRGWWLAGPLRLHLAAGHLVELRGNRLVARGANAVAELRLGVVGDVAFDLLPVLIVPANAL